MFEILETLGTTHVIITDGYQQIDDYVVYQHWRAAPDDPQGIYKYYRMKPLHFVLSAGQSAFRSSCRGNMRRIY